MFNFKDRKTTLTYMQRLNTACESMDHACMQYCMTINMTGGFSMVSHCRSMIPAGQYSDRARLQPACRSARNCHVRFEPF